MTPLLLALAVTGALALVGTGVFLLLRGRDGGLAPRLERVAAPLAAPAASESGARDDESIFRPVERRTWLSALRDRIQSVYPLLEAHRALPVALVGGIAGAAGGGGALWFLQVPAGWWTVPALGCVGTGAAWYTLRTLQARREAEFIRQFPEIVDQIVRLAGAGVPALEALAAVRQRRPEPGRAGACRSPRRASRGARHGDRPAPGERAGPARGVHPLSPPSSAFSGARAVASRPPSGTSRRPCASGARRRSRRRRPPRRPGSRLLVLAAMPAVVLVGQKFIAPQSVEILFGTEQGVTLLRWGVALIVTGILVARGLAARATR